MLLSRGWGYIQMNIVIDRMFRLFVEATVKKQARTTCRAQATNSKRI